MTIVDFSPWPYGIPAGLLLLYAGWKKDKAAWMGLATYFLTPTVGPGSIIVYAALVCTVAHTAVRIAFFAFLWAIAIYLLTF
jgi:hypothetical protein